MPRIVNPCNFCLSSLLLTSVCVATSLSISNAEEATDNGKQFEQIIRPLLREHCSECHGAKKQKGELRLDAKAFAFRGGESGPTIVAGKSEESPLWKRISSADADIRMPPNANPLTREQQLAVKQWIDAGATWPESDADRTAAYDTRRSHWSWQPIRLTNSQTNTSDRSPESVDAFLRKKLDAAGLKMSSQADRRTMIRRLTFDLIGLPPTPAEVEAFANDPDPQSHEKMVDRLLESPHYGERWARHWLDIAHYADTHGFERDQRRDNAWHYRDWVIRALNSDRPYNEFLRDQIAGDVLRPEDPDAVIATSFLAAGPWDFVGQAETKSEVLKRAARADDLDDIVTQVMTAACAVTVNCARCHDHKLDPISQKEYYGLWAVFAGVKRGERDVSSVEVQQHAKSRRTLESELQTLRDQRLRLQGKLFNLADIVGGGDGRGTGKKGEGIDPLSGKPQPAKRGFLEGAVANTFAKSTIRFIDGVVIPDASEQGTQISSTGLRVHGIPKTSGQAWDAIRFGPVNSPFSTTLGGTDFTVDGHTLLSLHANAAITFDLSQLREKETTHEWKFTAAAGYFGQTPKEGASFAIYVDGELKQQRTNIGRDDGLIEVNVILPPDSRFLTLMATDGGNGIGHDQIGFGDPWICDILASGTTGAGKSEVAQLQLREKELQQKLASLLPPAKVYGVVADSQIPVIKILKRGDPEQVAEEVAPGTLGCVTNLTPELGSTSNTDAERRIAFANWITSPDNPLTRRVIVNRLWHYHFGVGLVETPSDFGSGGGLPSHPELLDWLAEKLAAEKWSLKAMHRLICNSEAYRQRSDIGQDENSSIGRRADANNRMLWRMNPRRLDAESLRDSVLAVSGKLNREMYGPGYRDFEYQEEYAPVYRYITPDEPALWRRSVYRFVVRTTTHQFLTTLDCPSPANLVPARSVTTTALQSLALLNNDFMMRQSGYFAERIRSDAGSDAIAQSNRAFRLALGRNPSPKESAAAVTLLQSQGLTQLCRMLLNANEFVYVD